MTDNVIYSDLDFALDQTDEGDLNVLYNLDSIRQSIRNIILTPVGARTKYQDPDFGCGVFDLLGEKMNSATEILLQEEIETALNNYEPRVEVIEVTVESNQDANTYQVEIKYKVLAVTIEDTLTIDLEVLK